MGQYTTKGLYNSYDKNHKERSKTDYYATPIQEVENILNQLNIDFSNQTILEPCAGGGHMVQGILNYINKTNQNATIIATDLHYHPSINDITIKTGEEFDFLSDDYQLPKDEVVDWIIMNPPYSTIEPFTLRALEIADKGVIMLARLQFLEGQGRYETIFTQNLLSDVYVYVDRIYCWKDGIDIKESSAQAYCWAVFKKNNQEEPKIHWIRRKN